MKNIIFITLLLVSFSSFAQYHTTYNWSDTPTINEINSDESKESSIAILKKKIVEFSQSEITNDIAVFETTHNIIRVNDEAGVARHTQIYIPMYRVNKIVSLKARTITKDGKVTDLDENNIKQIENVDDYGDFQIFAIEGAEINSEIEVLYTLKKDYSPFGSETFQTDYTIQRAEMVFITNNLLGQIKTYNTDQEFERTYLDNMLVEELVISNILPVATEDYAATDANKIYTVYQCFGNPDLTQDDLWNNTVGNVASNFFPEKTSKIVIEEIKNNIMKDESIDISDYKKAMLIDNYVKSSYNVVENNNPQLEDIEFILQNRTASDYGILKAYAHFLKAFEIEYEVVVTANRYSHRFDPEFYNPNALREFLIYLPTLKQYITPDRLDYRLSEAPSYILGNFGVFIQNDMGYYFAKITQYDPDYSRVQRVMDISFTDDFDKVIVDESQEYTGHWSILYRALMTYYTGQDKEDVKDQLTGSGIEDKHTTKFEVVNSDMNQTEYNVPYIVNSTIESSALIEEAGDSYIFKLGTVIGVQSELYQEKERANPIEMQYPNQYNYTITVDIPKGYTLEGLESLEIHKELVVDGKKLCYWKSDYTLKDNQLIITIEEAYKVNDFPKEEYEGFRNVINAASDFNKAAILFMAE